MRRSAKLQIITEAIERLVPRSVPAHLRVEVVVIEELPGPGERKNTWSGTPAGFAERIATALYGRPSAAGAAVSPLAQAEDAKRRRDLAGELDALIEGGRSLESSPWYPLRPGDLVHIAYEQAGEMPPFGETYLIADAGDGLASMQLLAHTAQGTAEEIAGMVGCYAAEAAEIPLCEAWFEAGPHRLTIVRHGRVVHNGPGAGR